MRTFTPRRQNSECILILILTTWDVRNAMPSPAGKFPTQTHAHGARLSHPSRPPANFQNAIEFARLRGPEGSAGTFSGAFSLPTLPFDPNCSAQLVLVHIEVSRRSGRNSRRGERRVREGERLTERGDTDPLTDTLTASIKIGRCACAKPTASDAGSVQNGDGIRSKYVCGTLTRPCPCHPAPVM